MLLTGAVTVDCFLFYINLLIAFSNYFPILYFKVWKESGKCPSELSKAQGDILLCLSNTSKAEDVPFKTQ